MERIDLDALRKSLTNEDIINLVTALGADRYFERDGYIVFPTICHNEVSDEASMKLYYYENTGLFNCYTGCDESFNIFGLVQKVYKLKGEELPFYKAVSFVAEKSNFKIDDFAFDKKYISKADRFRKRQRSKELEIYEDKVLSVFSKKYPVEWLADGISKESMDKYNILFSDSRNKIIIPHYEFNGGLVGIRGRALNEDEVVAVGKYMPVEIEGKWYSHSLSYNLYGLNVSKENIRKNKKVIVFEAEKSCLQYDGMFDENISVAVCGSSFNINQLKLLIKNFEINEIIIAFDKEYEDYNSKKAKEYFDKLYNICKKYQNYCNFSFIFDRQGLLKEKDSPTDRGKKIFQELFNNRVKFYGGS